MSGEQKDSIFVGRADFCRPPVAYTLITNIYTPSIPLYQNIVAYSVGGLASFALCAIAMTWEERSKNQEAGWGRIYPRVVPIVGCGIEIAVAVVLALLLKRGELWRDEAALRRNR